MPLIECKLGPVETNVAGSNYVFQRDIYGRAVAEVHSMEHQICFLAVTHYRLAPDVPETEAEPELVIETAPVEPVVQFTETTPVVTAPAAEPVAPAMATAGVEPAEVAAEVAPVVTAPARKKGGRPSKKSLTGE